MRIVAGRSRGLLLAQPEGRAVRPSSDRLREALFNILHASYGLPQGAVVLDAFAGTGAVGLEALSRGAAHVLFIEQDAGALALVRENIRRLHGQGQATVLARDATRPGAAPRAADLVFLDPPYGKRLVEGALEPLLAAGWIAPAAVIVAEHAAGEEIAPPPGLIVDDVRRYGKAGLTFLARRAAPA